MHGDETFRNANGVYMKLMELRKYDPEYKGKGLGRSPRPVDKKFGIYRLIAWLQLPKSYEVHWKILIKAFCTSRELLMPKNRRFPRPPRAHWYREYIVTGNVIAKS